MLYNVLLPDGSKTKVDIPHDNVEDATEYVSSVEWIRNEFGHYVQTRNIVYIQKP
ncbi:MAG: hypothetical protein FWD44_06000 [Oscillospiraceae bacterium]|nr:hypothetical protein [Oscillospiraceae bacterium]